MRVIAGRFRGRRLVAPRGTATRPTTDRVREALFSTLGDVSDATVLDLYAGTGALGIEALSRGAERVVMVERARPALDAIAKNLRALDVEKQALVLRCPVERAERKLKEEAPFDLVFIDPPYATVNAVLDTIGGWFASPGFVKSSAVIVVEHAETDAPPSLAGCEPSRVRRYGDTYLSFFVPTDG